MHDDTDDPVQLSAVTGRGEPRCQQLTRAGVQCAKAAVEGRTRCKSHGGNGAGQPALVASRMNAVDQARLRKARERVESLRVNPLNPVESVATSKALLDCAIEQHFDDEVLRELFKRANAGREPLDGELPAFQVSRLRGLAADKAANAAIESRVQQQVAVQEAFLTAVLPLIERYSERFRRAIDSVLPEKRYPKERAAMFEALATNTDQTHASVLDAYDRAMK